MLKNQLQSITLLLFSTSCVAQTFTDVWSSAGFQDGEANQGVALGDYDGDGFTDIFTTSLFIENPIPFLPDLGGDDRCYHNDGSASFADRAPALGLDDPGQGQGAVWADYDNDGQLDLYVVRGFQEAVAESHLLYRQDAGSFDASPSVSVQDAGAGRGACWADYDNDGLLDVFVTNGLDSTDVLPDARVRLFRNGGDGTFLDVSVSLGIDDLRNGSSCSWSDYDKDGDMDVYVANHGFEDPVLGFSDPQPNALYKNLLVETGTASFIDVAEDVGVAAVDELTPGVTGGGAAFGCAWGDFDNDGWMDLFVANGFSGVVPFPTPNRLFHNNGDGSFSDRSLTIIDLDFDESSYGVTLGDYDNDGDLDAYVTNADVPFVAQADNDLFINNGFPFYILTNEAADAGVEVEEWATACASADFNGDGYLDIYSVNGTPGVELLAENADNLFLNNGGSNHWLQFDLVGVISNRNGVGARVTVEAGFLLSMLREVTAGTGYQSQDDLRVEFGLGSVDVARTVTVEWPSGCVQVLEDVEADQIVEIVEDCAVTPVQILRNSAQVPLAATFPLPAYAPAPASSPWLDPMAVLSDPRLFYYAHEDSAPVIRLRKSGDSVEISW